LALLLLLPSFVLAEGPCTASFGPGAANCVYPGGGDYSGDKFLLELERRSFLYFSENADPVTGLVKDKAPADGSGAADKDVASIAATGFGLSALCVGAENGWISRPEAEARAARTLEYFVERSTSVRGWYYHFTDQAGNRVWNSELSSIDTGLLLAGVLTARGCFSDDARLVSLADKFYSRIDFKWMLNGGSMLSHGWTPENGFLAGSWDTYSEHLFLTLLAIGAPRNAAPPEVWKAWRREAVSYDGYNYVSAAAPLFIHQYPQAYFDFRHVRDSAAPGEDLFLNSAVATEAHRQFCVDISTRLSSYSPQVWGITASDGKDGYRAWGGPPAIPDIDGTVVPCAAGGSLMFTPDLALPDLEAIKSRWGENVWERYGFVDAFNPAAGWFDTNTLAIDAGMTLLSAENLRTGAVWRWFMSNPAAKKGMELSGLSAPDSAKQ
jgi:hypothetical protein